MLETDVGFSVIRPGAKNTRRCDVNFERRPDTSCKLRGQALITDDGEAIKGGVLEEVEVIYWVTFFIKRAFNNDGCAVMRKKI